MQPQTISRLTYDWFWTVKRKPNKKWQANLKIFLFEKLKTWGWLEQFREDRVQMKSLEIYEDALLDLIHNQMDQLVDSGKRPTEVILGYEQWMRLTSDPDFRNYFHFTWAPTQGGYYPPLFGMKVRVVPYINGVVVLPEDR